MRSLESALCANDGETLTFPGITVVEGGERCLSHGEPFDAREKLTAYAQEE